ncbi:uncharacterized protein LOC118442546 isoform X1 [Vespa mandarinia]|uniref:uncharacterized protein LOC118442546 isoform X1 n=1 Tax=Vespa mandarinia TaxID=7446 RepID=UPI0016228038|nr:uncharacterized protein LOC118442546 isoform X1 [Vespa mandarinia]
MSEELDNDGTLKSHEFGPPKSLQKMENADILWKMITKRFPNAAPLLCEMEAVIDRADDLLRQLRRPYGRSVEVSSLNNFADSGESDEVISLICDESFPEDTEVFEDVAIMTNTVETQISKSSVTTVDTDFDSILSNQPSSLIGQKSNNSTDDLKEEENGKESNKNVDECKSEESVQEQIESTSNSKKNFEKIQENEKKHSSGDWNENINVENHSSTINDTEEMEIYKNVEITDIYERDKIITFSGDENINKRTPWDILEEYANQCNINIDYHCEKNKCNRFVISGKLSEFSATGCGDTEDLAKNNIAKKILQNIADHQMNDKKMKQLLELSREQILEIINFENDDTNETPLRKVYMLCIKKGGSAPRYITGREYKHQGVKCVAKCMALNHVVEGEGVSRHNAKKAAAEQFYQKYSDNEI